jgi:hypothetical protein
MPAERRPARAQTVAVVDLEQTKTCNCSQCRRLAAVLSAVELENFRLKFGESNLTEYTINKGVMRHRFCKTCGIQLVSTCTTPNGTAMVAIDVNCLDGVEPSKLNSLEFDGRSL